MDKLLQQAIGNIQKTANNLFIKPAQQAIYNWGVQNPQQSQQVAQIPRQAQQSVSRVSNFIGSQQLPVNNITPFKLPQITLGQVGNQLSKNVQSSIQQSGQLARTMGTPTRLQTPQQQEQFKQNIPTLVGNIGGFAKPQLAKFSSYLKQVARPEDINLIKQFATWVETTGGKGNPAKANIPIQNIHAIARDVFGDGVTNYNNKQLKNLFDATLQEVGKGKNNLSLGLAVDDIRKGKPPVANAGPLRTKVKPGSYSNLKVADNRLAQVEPLPWEAPGYKPSITTDYKGKFVNPSELRAKPQVVEENMPQLPSAQTKLKPTSPQSQNVSFDDIVRSSDIKVKDKVNVLDYLRTPDRVLTKMGLGKESELIKRKYDDYLSELPKEIEKVTNWSKQVSPEANQRIFKYLDGSGTLTDKTELKVASEVKDYLAGWADRLGLPADKRITNYITHIFDKDFIQKEFDPEIAALIRDRVAGSVYDPFVEQRLGKAGYIEDTWRALDAYVKRATRKANMDDALGQISKKADFLEESQFNYVKKYIDKVNMRPGQIDNLIDNTVKSVIGYKLGQRPLASVSRTLRQMVYRGTLGLNVGSAVRNLTQGANTYAKLGEKYTAVGYYRLAKEIATKGDELERVGVLRDNFIQDRTISATGKFWEKLDKGLWAFFQAAEKINRGSAYFGAKAQALSKGLNEQEAIEFGKKMVRDTQFTFGSVDTPQVLQSDIAKTLLQFQSYNLKQAEFLVEMAKSKDFAGLARFGVASTAMLYTIGSLIGMKPTDFIPFYGVATGQTKIGETPPVKIVKDIAGTLANSKDQFGQEQDLEDRLRTFGNDLIPFIPAGVQIKKTLGGLGDTNRGYAETRTGNVKFPVGQDVITKLRAAAFGTNNLPEGQDYYNNKVSPLSKNQSNIYKESQDKQGFYNQVLKVRGENKAEDQLKEQVKQGGSQSTGDKIYYNLNGEVKTINLSAPTAGEGIDAFTNQNWQYTKAREVWKNKDKIPSEQFNAALKQLGIGTGSGETKIGNLSVSTREADNFPFPDYSKSAPGQVLRADLNFAGSGDADIVFHFKTPDGKVINVPQTKEKFNGKDYYGLELKIPNGIKAGTGEVWATVNGKEIVGTRKPHQITNTQAIDRYSDQVRQTQSNDPTLTRETFVKNITAQDIEYDYKAHHSTDIKSQYIASKASTMTHKALLDELVKGRQESVSGYVFANDATLTRLNEQGVISDQEMKTLKSMKVTKDGNTKLKVKKLKKPKKISPIKVKRATAYKLKNIKLKKAKKLKALTFTTPKKLKVKKS